MIDKKISMKLNLDQELTPYEEPSERILEVALQAPEVDEAYKRPPLNLALVIDRSGSMSGEKVEYAKQAASHVVGLMEAKDRVALVQYDNEVDVLFPSTLLDNESLPTLLKGIASIYTRGSTNLCGGWLTGCQEIAGTVRDDTFTHAMLLSDGLANVGTTDHKTIAAHAMELARRGVSTSTFGIGADYDQHLLEDMANLGEGTFKFIESPQDIPGIFESVFKELLTIYAHKIEVTLIYPSDLKATVLGDYRNECPEPGKLRIFLGSLSAGKSRDIFLKLSIPAGMENTALPIKVSLRAKDENGELMELESDILIKLVRREEAEAAPKNELLLKRFALVEVGDRASAALRLEKEGKRQEASELLNKILETQRDHLNPEMQVRYQNMSQRMAQGMDELDRKRSHFDSYTQKKFMAAQQTYQLISNVKGHLIFDLNGRLVLLDTGSQVSFGKRKHLEFMGRQLHLPPDFKKLSPEYLSQMIGVPIEFLLGMDVLKELYFQIDVRRRKVHFSELPLPAGNLKIQLETHMDVPYTRIKMNGAPQKVFVDTGAKINFLRKQVLTGLEAMDTEMDFSPYIGEFETKVYEISIELAGETHLMHCGVLPPLLETALANTGGIEGLLGTEIFDKYIATFEPGTQLMSLERY